MLCLPHGEGGRYLVTAKLRNACRPWLERLITDVEARVVCAVGAKALESLGRVERHGLKLNEHAGQLHPWFGRKILPLYHPRRLGRVSRSAEQQKKDIEALVPELGLVRT